MGIVNATPDSFSDGGIRRTHADRVELARSLLAAGADLIDIGGESGVTNRPAVDPQQEIDRVVPLIEAVAGDLEAIVSIDTYKAPVAEAAIAAGAAIVNDPSGLHDPRLAEVCARTGAGLILTHNRAAPKQKLLDEALDGRVLSDVMGFLEERVAHVTGRGVAFEQLLLDPGPDLSKTPAQTVEALRGLRVLHSLGRPLLLAVSRKDFVGAITGRPPQARLAGTLAAIGEGTDAGAHVVRVHDVAQASEFLAVRAALRGELELDPGLRLRDELRWDQGQRPGRERAGPAPRAQTRAEGPRIPG
jgi:dihydropteroate synthase